MEVLANLLLLDRLSGASYRYIHDNFWELGSHIFQYLFKAGKYSEVLSIIQDKSSNINVNELLDCGVAPIHLASASGSLV